MTRKKWLVLFLAALLVYTAITLAVVFVYRHGGITDVQARILQNATYAVLLLGAVLTMKLTGAPLGEFGLFWHKLPVQLAIGAATGGCFVFLMIPLGKIPEIGQGFWYLLCSQILVGRQRKHFGAG